MKRTNLHPRQMQQLHRFKGDERCLFGGLRHDAISGGESSRNLADENGERKIPRTDADENAPPAVTQFVALAGWAWQRPANKCAPRLAGIVATMIRGFAHFCNAIVDRLAALILQESDQRRAILLDQIAGALEQRGPICDRRCVPCRKSGLSRGKRSTDDRFITFLHRTDRLAIDW